MPELPEVETVCRGLRPLLLGRHITHVDVRVKKLRAPLPKTLATHLSGRKITAIERRAKYILIRLSGGQTLIVHLGMTGGFGVRPAGTPPNKHDHILFTLDGHDVIAFFDPRRFGHVALAHTSALNAHPTLHLLGPEPLDRTFTGQILQARLANKRVAIKPALLDQRVVAGIGNIYASEALFYAGIHPERPAGTLTLAECTDLARAIKHVLRRSIAAGGSTLKDYRQVNGEVGFFQDRFAVYDRAGQKCPGCTCNPLKTGGIHRTVHGGRATYFCAKKQTI